MLRSLAIVCVLGAVTVLQVQAAPQRDTKPTDAKPSDAKLIDVAQPEGEENEDNQPEVELIDYVISPFDCIERGSSWGESAACPEEYVATSLCTSGSSALCGNYYNTVRCCPITNKTRITNCARNVHDAEAGLNLICPYGSVVNAICASSTRPACGRDMANRIDCWPGSGLDVTGFCNWRTGNFGEVASCSLDEVVTGVCSSEDTNSCGTNSHSVLCCLVL